MVFQLSKRGMAAYQSWYSPGSRRGLMLEAGSFLSLTGLGFRIQMDGDPHTVSTFKLLNEL